MPPTKPARTAAKKPGLNGRHANLLASGGRDARDRVISPRNARQNLIRAGMSSRSMWSPHMGALSSVESIIQEKLALLPSTISATRTDVLPMNPTEAEDVYGTEVSFIENIAVQRSQGLITKLVSGGTPASPFFLRGLAIIGRVEPYAYTLTGGSMPTPTESGTDAARAYPVMPAGAELNRPGCFSYGHNTWKAVPDFLQAYDFQYLLQGRYLLVNERAIDMGLLDSHWRMQGFGTAAYCPLFDISVANAHYGTDAVDKGSIFLPVNTSHVGTNDDPSTGVPVPTVDVQWGGPLAPGVFGCFFPVRPHVLFPGQTYEFLFTRQVGDTVYHSRFLADISDREFDQPDPNLNPFIAAAGFEGAVWIGAIPFEYGVIQLGMMLRGVEVLPEDCMEFFIKFGYPYMGIYGADQRVIREMQEMASGMGLAGIPIPLHPGDWRMSERGNALAGVSDSKVSRDDRISAIKELMRGENGNELVWGGLAGLKAAEAAVTRRALASP